VPRELLGSFIAKRVKNHRGDNNTQPLNGSRHVRDWLSGREPHEASYCLCAKFDLGCFKLIRAGPFEEEIGRRQFCCDGESLGYPERLVKQPLRPSSDFRIGRLHLAKLKRVSLVCFWFNFKKLDRQAACIGYVDCLLFTKRLESVREFRHVALAVAGRARQVLEVNS
jgi:hypothetical protein